MTSSDDLARGLVADVLASDDDGIPALLVVHDYAERKEIAEALRDEAAIHGVTVQVLDAAEAARDKLLTLKATQSDAVVLLINAGTMAAWTAWLEPLREQLPEHVRFLVVVAFKEDVPDVARLAPAFWSWVKADVYRTSDSNPVVETADPAKEIMALTGLSPREFIVRWEQGDLPDSWQNASLVNLALAATRDFQQ